MNVHFALLFNLILNSTVYQIIIFKGDTVPTYKIVCLQTFEVRNISYLYYLTF